MRRAEGQAAGWRRAVSPIVLAALTAGACAPQPPSQPVPAAADCVVHDDRARPRITLAVAAPDPATPVHSAARLVDALLHETLIQVDCTGTLIAGLAEEWTSGDGRVWQFRIAPGATFTDGTPVDARSIAAAWSTSRSALLADVTAVSGFVLHVTLHAAADAGLFASREFAVVRQIAGEWPAGTGRYAPDASSRRPVLRLLARSPADGEPVIPAGSVPDTIDVRSFGTDMRTALDAGVDALVARDASVIAYARARADYALTPLPWDRVYILASSVPVAGFAAGDGLAEVVRENARPARETYDWQRCTTTDAVPARPTDARVLYDRDDAVARAVAERLVALALDPSAAWPGRAAGGSTPVAEGVDGRGLSTALRERTALAVVLSAPSLPAGCAAFTATTGDMTAWSVVPLIETHASLIHRPGIGRIVANGDGTIRFGTR